MKIGDIVLYRDRRWLVTHRMDGRLCALKAWDGAVEAVPETFDRMPDSGLTVAAQPLTWPFLTLPMRAKAGPVVKITRNVRVLIPFVDWAPQGGLLRPGGAFFFNPELGLRLADVLVAHHEKGALSRLTVGPGFITFAQRQTQARQAAMKAPPATVFDHMIQDDD